MSGIKDLGTLLKSMKPEHIKGTFVFCTVPEKKLVGLEISPILIFRESEGITIVVEKEVADKNSFCYEGEWGLITLNVHSDLSAVGFLAAITKKLAESRISVNAVSAYYHDHLFVPITKVSKAMRVLAKLTKDGIS